MSELLMPKATAIWLVDNTALTFKQIADLTGLHEVEVQGIADGYVGQGMLGLDPVHSRQLSREEIEKGVADPDYKLKLFDSGNPKVSVRSSGPRYTPVSKRQDKPDAVAWLLRHHPELNDAQIGRLVGTTRPTIEAVRSQVHRTSSTSTPRSPVEIGYCRQDELDRESEKALLKLARREEREAALMPSSDKPPAGLPGDLSGEVEQLSGAVVFAESQEGSPEGSPDDIFKPSDVGDMS